MNVLKQSFRYITRKKGKTLTLFLFILIMATMLLSCFSLFSATKDAEKNLKKALLSSFTVNAKNTENGLTENTLKEILSVDGLSGQYTLRSYMQATYYDINGKELDIETEGVSYIPQGYEHAGKIVANSKSEKDTYFTDAGFTLIEGQHIDENNHGILLHEEFARNNHLSVGDFIYLGDISNTEKRVKAEIIGLFTNTKEQDSIGLAPSYDLYSNIGFIDIATASTLLYNSETLSSQYGDFYVNDPAELDNIIENVNAISDKTLEQSIVTKYDNDYQNAKKSLDSLMNIIFIAMLAVSIICFIVLSLFLALRIRSRIHETGILLAMGISKKFILLQYLTEVLIIALLAFALSFVTSSFVNHKIGNTLISETIQNKYEVIHLSEDNQNESEQVLQNHNSDIVLADIQLFVSQSDYLFVCSIGLMLCLISTAVAIIPVMKMKPKNILSQIN